MTSEKAVSNQVREAFQLIGPLWRNNVGVLPDRRGVPVRYGLANESKDQNSRFKSSDFIGITPTLITPDMVGTIVGVFTAPEIKHSNWTFKPGDPHQEAQLNFHNLVRASGGFAGFISHPNQLLQMIGR